MKQSTYGETLQRFINTDSCIMIGQDNYWCLNYFQPLFICGKMSLICQLVPCSICTNIWKELILSLFDYEKDHISTYNAYNAQNSAQVVYHLHQISAKCIFSFNFYYLSSQKLYSPIVD